MKCLLILWALLLAISIHPILASAGCPGNYCATVLALNPRGFWPLNETSGSIMNDASNNGHNGAYQTTGVTLGAAGIINDGSGNTAASFAHSGTNQYLASVPNSATIALTSFTFVMWFKAAGGSTTNDVVVSMDGESTSAGQGGWEPFRDNNTGDGNTADYRLDTTAAAPAANLISGLELFDGNIHLLACGVTANTAFISVDAGTYQTASITGTYAAPTVALVFGNTLGSANNGTLPASGTYQGAAIFSAQLSQANLTALYTCGTGGSCPVIATTPGISTNQVLPLNFLRAIHRSLSLELAP